MVVDRPLFFTGMRAAFGKLSRAQVDGTEPLLSALEGEPAIHLAHAAYIFATAWHETAATMQPVRETLASTDTEAIRRLDLAWLRGKLPQVKTPYWRLDANGRSWLGRGYVQLTHERNYAKAEMLTGIPLSQDPSLAMVPAVSAAILVKGALSGMFTGKRLADYLPGNYIEARRVINGLDRASLVAEYARRFEPILRGSVSA
jgi:hypothetical protein